MIRSLIWSIYRHYSSSNEKGSELKSTSIITTLHIVVILWSVLLALSAMIDGTFYSGFLFDTLSLNGLTLSILLIGLPAYVLIFNKVRSSLKSMLSESRNLSPPFGLVQLSYGLILIAPALIAILGMMIRGSLIGTLSFPIFQ